MGFRTIENFDSGVDTEAPLGTILHSHETIVEQLRDLARLPQLLKQAEQARDIAAATLALFRGELLQHHEDEERDLFPAVLRSAQPGEERELVRWATNMLTCEHRSLEALWKELAPSMRAAAKGQPACPDPELVARLAHEYRRHARFEERHFLPLAEKILARNPDHMGALGIAMHLRRMPDLPGYV